MMACLIGVFMVAAAFVDVRGREPSQKIFARNDSHIPDWDDWLHNHQLRL